MDQIVEKLRGRAASSSASGEMETRAASPSSPRTPAQTDTPTSLRVKPRSRSFL